MPKSIARHKVFKVVLSDEGRADLAYMTRQRSIGVAKKRWATILLLADEAHPEGGRTDEEIAAEVGITVRQIERVRKKFVLQGMDQRSSARPAPMRGCPRSSMARPRLIWSRSAAALRPMAANIGQCNCFATSWSASKS